MAVRKLSEVEEQPVVTTPSFFAVLAALGASVGVFGHELGYWVLSEYQELSAQVILTVSSLLAFLDRTFAKTKVTKFW